MWAHVTGRPVQKYHVGLAAGILVTSFFLLSALRVGPLELVRASAIVALPLAAVATFLVTLIWILEAEARQAALHHPAALLVAMQARLVGLASLVYFSFFFGLWMVLDHLSTTINWHHFALILLFLVWQLALAAYGYDIKRRLAALTGEPMWWWRRPAPHEPAPDAGTA